MAIAFNEARFAARGVTASSQFASPVQGMVNVPDDCQNGRDSGHPMTSPVWVMFGQPPDVQNAGIANLKMGLI